MHVLETKGKIAPTVTNVEVTSESFAAKTSTGPGGEKPWIGLETPLKALHSLASLEGEISETDSRSKDKDANVSKPTADPGK